MYTYISKMLNYSHSLCCFALQAFIYVKDIKIIKENHLYLPHLYSYIGIHSLLTFWEIRLIYFFLDSSFHNFGASAWIAGLRTLPSALFSQRIVGKKYIICSGSIAYMLCNKKNIFVVVVSNYFNCSDGIITTYFTELWENQMR